jgi:hypothetical protein
MHPVVEMLGLHDVRDAVEDIVVDQERAEQRLLGLDVVGKCLRAGEVGGGSVCHWVGPPCPLLAALYGFRAGAGLWITRISGMHRRITVFPGA